MEEGAENNTALRNKDVGEAQARGGTDSGSDHVTDPGSAGTPQTSGSGPSEPAKRSVKHVRILKDGVARKIAAGEVIDRPYAAVRELLDNAIDAGAKNITLSLQNGGIDEIQVRDDGQGMSRDDLEVCWLPHATSKIASENDLEHVRTLGFRGEALSSLAACSRLRVVSSQNGRVYRLSVNGNTMMELVPDHGVAGTTVSACDLFFNLPARRRFLRSTRAENSISRRIFVEKALAHPELNFRFLTDGNLKLFLPASSPLERIRATRSRTGFSSQYWETHAEGPGFTLTVIHCRPEDFRRDRRGIEIYVNRRRINEYSLTQSVEHAYDAWMPGGLFPIAFVFVEADPQLVDFNIHPAKKEVRFRDLPAIRQRLIESIKDRIVEESYRKRGNRTDDAEVQQKFSNQFSSPETANRAQGGGATVLPRGFGSVRKPDSGPGTEVRDGHSNADRFVEQASRFRDTPGIRDLSGVPFLYLGRAMGVFLLAECRESLYIVDQHAAHERILFERYLTAGPVSERLLIPRPLELERDAAIKLELRKDRLRTLGLEIEHGEDGSWLLLSVPQTAKGLESEIVEFLESGAGEAENLEKSLWADLACKAAVKDRTVLDDEAARKLIRDTFDLKIPRCPHGRPLWFEVSREELFSLVGRT